MKLGKPVYRWNKQGRLVINYTYGSENNTVLNLLETSWVDCRYGIAKQAIAYHSVIAISSDLIAHDDYIQRLDPKQSLVLVVFREGPGHASKFRLRKAVAKLRERKIRVKYFVDETKFEQFISELSA
jgi:hypothetical protein